MSDAELADIRRDAAAKCAVIGGTRVVIVGVNLVENALDDLRDTRAALQASEQRCKELDDALSSLVSECTPSAIPLDGGKHYGVRMPSRESVDSARSRLREGVRP